MIQTQTVIDVDAAKMIGDLRPSKRLELDQKPKVGDPADSHLESVPALQSCFRS